MKNTKLLLLLPLLSLAIACKKEFNPAPVEVSVVIKSPTETTDSSTTLNFEVSTNEPDPALNIVRLIVAKDTQDFWNKSYIEMGAGYGPYTRKMTGLEKATRYYYGVTSSSAVPGTARSVISSFETLYRLPTLSDPQSAFYITPISANFLYTIKDFGGPRVIETGVCYSTNPNPTVNDMKYIMDTAVIPGIFPWDTVGIMTNLNSNTKYYARAYARNNAGVGYSKEVVFTTLPNNTCFVKPIGIGTDGVYDVKLRDGSVFFAGKFKYVNGFLDRHSIAKTTQDGTLAGNFKYDMNAGTFAGKNVEFLDNGKIMMAVTTTAVIQKLIRINPDGTIDPSFNTGGTETRGEIFTFRVQPDGKTLVSGPFSSFNGTQTSHLVRLNTNGSLDPNFQFLENAFLEDLHILPDGRIMALGRGQDGKFIRRLNPDGKNDNTYTSALNSLISTMAITPITSSLKTPDDKLVVAYIDANSNPRIVRVNAYGSLDPGFAMGTISRSTTVTMIYRTKDDKYIIGGNFTSYNGTVAYSLVRLNNDGTLDNTFNAGQGFAGSPYSMTETNDGKLIIGGKFTSYRDKPVQNITMINSNGTLCQ
jgi:uncharacterized delta-60 repeat protein